MNWLFFNNTALKIDSSPKKLNDNSLPPNLICLHNISCRLFDHVQMLPADFFSKGKKGEILSLISNDANVIAYFISGVLTSLVPSVLIASGVLILMASINLQLAAIIAFSVPAFFIILKLLGRKIRPLSEQLTQQLGQKPLRLQLNAINSLRKAIF